MELRSLSKEDIEILDQIVKLFKKQNLSYHYIEVFLSQKNNYILAALDGGNPIGFLLAYELPRFDREEAMLFIYEIEVHPDYRNRGIGTALIKKIKSRFKSGKIMKMFVLTNGSNQPAMKLYESTNGNRPNQDDVLFVYKGE